MSATATTGSNVAPDDRRLTKSTTLEDISGHPSISYWRRVWRRFRSNVISMIALVIFLLILIFALSAGIIAHHITHMGYADNHLPDKLAPIFSSKYYLGTDGNGRDVLTRLAYGGRVSLFIAALASVAILGIGGTIGAVSGYFGGIVDSIGMRAADILLSIPGLPLLILVSAFYQPGVAFLAIIIALLSWAGVCRLIRGEVLSLKRRDYVEAARVLGASHARIIWKHIIPNVMPVIIVFTSLVIPSLILTEASLSYLGVGVRVPNPSWGNMLQDAKPYLRLQWTLVFIPGFAIYITVLSLYLVGNGLRDALDPRLNS